MRSKCCVAKTTVICITVVLIIWITHRSLCEFRFRIAPF
ncbi:Hok/Gef family protein [Escherichia coli]|nr:Hok/Gef family protein [Escherichia coli]EEC8423742.1 Hok/Gef family protein [Escherichia coli]EEQ3554076.1 Hok/Gef family protein [Escherichia coli]EEQ7963546.1 Hok/Gef family protein [Escherichia coli]EEQ8152572.1 Hok/Gef family protein [Escherichia coli]